MGLIPLRADETTCFQDILCVTATTFDEHRGVSLTLENRSSRSITATLSFPVFENMKANHPLPFSATLPAKGINRDLVLTARDREKSFRWNFDARWAEGSFRSAPDAGASYCLPFTPGRVVSVLEGEDSPAHEGLHSAAIDFAAPLGTPVSAARAGRVGAVQAIAKNVHAVEVVHADGTVAMYLPLTVDRQRLELDEPVEAGRHLGFLADDGASPARLHFALFAETPSGDPQGIPVAFRANRRSAVPAPGERLRAVCP